MGFCPIGGRCSFASWLHLASEDLLASGSGIGYESHGKTFQRRCFLAGSAVFIYASAAAASAVEAKRRWSRQAAMSTGSYMTLPVRPGVLRNGGPFSPDTRQFSRVPGDMPNSSAAAFVLISSFTVLPIVGPARDCDGFNGLECIRRAPVVASPQCGAMRRNQLSSFGRP